MRELEIMQKFRDNWSSTGIEVEDLGSELSLFGIFLRKDFVAHCLSNVSFTDLIRFIETAFKLSEIEKVEQNIPFLLIEDLVEVGSYSALEHLLPYLDEKSNIWLSVKAF